MQVLNWFCAEERFVGHVRSPKRRFWSHRVTTENLAIRTEHHIIARLLSIAFRQIHEWNVIMEYKNIGTGSFKALDDLIFFCFF